MKKIVCCLLLSAFGARAAEPPPPPPPDTGFAETRYQRVRLRLLTSDPDVELRNGGGQLVCKAPCETTVPVLEGDRFTLEGPGLLGSDAFSFAPDDSDVTLRVHAGSRAQRITGVVLTCAGGGIVTTWVSLFGLLAIASANSDSRVHQPVQAARGRELFIDPTQSGGGQGPWLVLGTGAVLLVAGIAVLANTHSTSFTREPAGAQ
jgi:hypothetical protein